MATLWSQLLEGPRSFAVSWKLLNKGSWKLFISYTLSAFFIVGFSTLFIISMGPTIKEAFISYVLPPRWFIAGRMIIDNLLVKMGSIVLANFVLQGGMTAISVCCFAIKEFLSRRIEHDNALLPFGHAPWPLWRQAVEECKFAFLYLVAYDVIFWLGYPPWGVNRIIAQILSTLTLFVFFNITFMCPLFLRHRIGYGRMIRTFFRRPLASFGFAALFLTPHLILATCLRGAPIGVVTCILLATHVLTVAPAATAGTWMAARLLSSAKELKPSPQYIKTIFMTILAAFLIVSGWVFLNLAGSIDKKSQILKCNYNVDLGSFNIEPPSLFDWSVKVSIEIEIENPTKVDVHIENSRLEVRNANQVFAEAQLADIKVPAGTTVRKRVQLGVEIDLTRLLEYKQLYEEDWDVVLWVKVKNNFEFPVYFR